MKLTMSSEMGIHSVWFLASVGSVKPVLSAQIAQGIRVSESYLIKVLKRLVKAKVLTSKKGKCGGYVLRKDPRTITLADILQACEGEEGIYDCLHDQRGCKGLPQNCPICIALNRAEHVMLEELSRVTIQQLADFGWGLPIPPGVDDSHVRRPHHDHADGNPHP